MGSTSRVMNGKYSPKGWDCNASGPLNAGKNDDSNWMLHPFGEYLRWFQYNPL